MSERRYVVEIARAVSDDRIESAADYVAARLGMDRQRIRTLLAGRTGPVTRPVLAEKADSLAEVFTAAGVAVLVIEALSHETHAERSGDGQGDMGATPSMASTDYEADYQEAFGQETDAPLGAWHVDAAWDDEDDDAPWEEQAVAGAPAQDHGERTETPHEPASADTAETKLPSTRWVPSPFDEPLDAVGPGEQRGDDLKVTWAGRSEPKGADRTGVAGGEGDELETSASRPWVTTGRSQFGDLSTPAERTPLRTYLMWGLVVSVVLLIVLQLLFAVRERGAAGAATYESGLQAYRSADFVVARRHWEEVAKTGSAEAQYMLGHLVQNGLGQPWSNAQAAVWYRQAADQGLPQAQVALADLYIRGVGVEPSLETGAQWLERAAGSGFGPALYQYAELRLHGRGVSQDFDAALDLFSRAAAAGSNEAADYVALAAHVRGVAATGSAQP